MIKIINKADCCGCQACGDICPKNSISFKTDEEGIWYPEFNLNTCIDCHLCERVCPILNNSSIRKGNSQDPPTYILQHEDNVERFNSTSGCIYPLIAKYILGKSGYIAGHVYDENWGVKALISNKVEDLEQLRNSKYCQSDVQGFYKTIKSILLQGKFVLASGCPCQIAGLKNYLSKDYENLLTIDFTCMGIDNPFAFRKYIESLEDIFGSKIKTFKSKSKEIGWRRLTNKATFENGKTYYGINGVDSNLVATFMDILVRPSCYDCKFKGKQRIADISIGDFWTPGSWNNYDTLDFSIDDNSGTSYMMLNNKKAEIIYEEIKNMFKQRKINADTIIKGNPYSVKSLPKPKIDREKFYKNLHIERFDKIVDSYNSNKKSSTKSRLSAIKQVVIHNKFNLIGSIRCLYYNIFSKNIVSDFWNGDIFLFSRHTRLVISKDSKLFVKGRCIIQEERMPVIIKLCENSKLHLNNSIFQGGNTIISCRNKASVRIGYLTSIYEGTRIASMEAISIGDFCQLSRNVIVTDNNEMVLTTADSKGLYKRIEIGTHCLIKDGTIIRKGCSIGDEVITKEYSVIEGDIPAKTCVGYDNSSCDNILWKNNF